MLKKLTKNYIDFFSKKDIDSIELMLCEEFVLCDPVVKRVEGRSNCLKAINDIFSSCDELVFIAKNIFVDNEVSIIEFVLKLDDTSLEGVDIIEWRDNKMKELRAYLDIPKK